MGKKKSEQSDLPKIRPALSQEARENQMIALAVDLAEKQLLEGTASSQVITHFLKLGTSKYQYELEKLKSDTKLQNAKVSQIADQKAQEELYLKALEAMRDYSGFKGSD